MASASVTTTAAANPGLRCNCRKAKRRSSIMNPPYEASRVPVPCCFSVACPLLLLYSVLSASIGSTAVARCAGRAEASATISAVSSKAIIRTAGSHVLTP